MIRISDRSQIKSLLLNRSKLQDEYVKACAKTAEKHEANYIRQNKKDFNLLTIWYIAVVMFVVVCLFFYLYDLLEKAVGKILIIVLLLGLLSFLGMILFRKKNTKKLKKAWDEDLKKANTIRDEANKVAKEAADLCVMIMAYTEHHYIENNQEGLFKWKQILYEYVEVINKEYKGATIDDFLDFYIKWENRYFKV